MPGLLKQIAGQETLPASAITVASVLPFPADQWTLKYLGDERGLNAAFPDSRTLDTFAAMEGQSGPWGL